MSAAPRPTPDGFAGVADLYERGRPDYPDAAIDVLRAQTGLAEGARVLDLAAGTGKLTRPLRAAGAHVTAVEPLAELRPFLKADAILDGTAEAIPVQDASVDLVTAGDAWHWFDWPRAAGELARVVRPGGAAALLWQTPFPDRAPGWRRDVGRLLLSLRGDHPNFRDEQGRPALDAHAAFDGLREHVVPFSWEPGPEELLDCVCSFSFIGAMTPAERAGVREQVRALLPNGPLDWPYETRVWVTHRAPAQTS